MKVAWRNKTDELQCGKELPDLNRVCPKKGMVLYDGDDFDGKSIRVDGETSLQTFQPNGSIAVLGEQAWVLHSSSLFNTSAPHKILLPGRYAHLQEAGVSDFVPVAAEPYIPAISVKAFPSEEVCKKDETLKLFDDNPLTCMDVKGVLKLHIASTQPVHQLVILTRAMDCAQPFHVSVCIRRQVNFCQMVEVGQLMAYSYMNGTELSECAFTVPQGDGDVIIRLAAVDKASICSVKQTVHAKDN